MYNPDTVRNYIEAQERDRVQLLLELAEAIATLRMIKRIPEQAEQIATEALEQHEQYARNRRQK